MDTAVLADFCDFICTNSLDVAADTDVLADSCDLVCTNSPDVAVDTDVLADSCDFVRLLRQTRQALHLLSCKYFYRKHL